MNAAFFKYIDSTVAYAFENWYDQIVELMFVIFARTLWRFYSSYKTYHDTIMVIPYFYQSSAATAYGQITFLCQKHYCLVQYCFDVLDSIFGAKKEIQIMCDQLRFVQHFHEMRHLVFFFVEDNNQMSNIRTGNSTLSDPSHQLYFCWRTILPPYVAQMVLDNWLAFS